MGRKILYFSAKNTTAFISVSSCISNLLELLANQELSPQVTQTVIILLQTALPAQAQSQQPEAKIMEMLLGKLGSLIAPIIKSGSSQAQAEMTSIQDNAEVSRIDQDMDSKALMLHKRPDQSGHELIQQLLNASSDIGLFSAMGSDSMEKVIKIDKDINSKNCAEVLTGDATRVMRAATKMAQLGFVVSIAAPNQLHDHGSHGWKHKALQICQVIPEM